MTFETTRRTRARAHFKQRLLLGFIVALLTFATGLVIHPQAYADVTPPCYNITCTPPPTIPLTRDSSSAGYITIPAGAIGVNTPSYEGSFAVNPGTAQAAAAVTAVQQAGINMFRYPGGSNADYYQWENNKPSPVDASYYKNYGSPLWPNTPYVASSNGVSFDHFMSQVNNAGGQADIVVNYGSGTPQEAAAWVAYANTGQVSYDGITAAPGIPGYSSTGHHYGILYWEIGNEVYGDGYYGTPNNKANWEYVTPGTKLDPTTYAQQVVNYSIAMKKADPSIQVGAVLTMPGDFPDDNTLAANGLSGFQPWDATVLSTPQICQGIDFVAVHWYPQQPSTTTKPGNVDDAGLLAAPEQGTSTSSPGQSLVQKINELKQRMIAACGATRAAQIGIRVTEANSVAFNPQKQTAELTNALFLDDAYMTFLEAGVQSVDWWSLYGGWYQQPVEDPTSGQSTSQGVSFFLNQVMDPNDPGNPNSLSPPSNTVGYGDYGLLSNGSYYRLADSTVVAEALLNTPFPSYYGMAFLSHLLGPKGAAGGHLFLPNNPSSNTVDAHIVLQADGHTMGVMLINKDPSNYYSVTVNLPAGYQTGASLAKSWYYTPYTIAAAPWPNIVIGNPPPPWSGATSIPKASTSITITVAPYSTNVMTFPT